jgi:hypothetical protein
MGHRPTFVINSALQERIAASAVTQHMQTLWHMQTSGSDCLTSCTCKHQALNSWLHCHTVKVGPQNDNSSSLLLALTAGRRHSTHVCTPIRHHHNCTNHPACTQQTPTPSAPTPLPPSQVTTPSPTPSAPTSPPPPPNPPESAQTTWLLAASLNDYKGGGLYVGASTSTPSQPPHTTWVNFVLPFTRIHTVKPPGHQPALPSFKVMHINADNEHTRNGHRNPKVTIPTPALPITTVKASSTSGKASQMH